MSDERSAIDVRRYRWTIGALGAILIVAFSIYTLTRPRAATPGVPAGQRLHRFVAPLAASTLNGDANVSPRCDPAHPNPRALNMCAREPLVLALFATGSSKCIHEVDVLQRLGGEFPVNEVTFAAVAVGAGHGATAALVRRHRWTIPVAYDADGAVGELYGAAVCPIVEVAGWGGIVTDRLIGDHWLDPTALGGRVRAMLAQGR